MTLAEPASLRLHLHDVQCTRIRSGDADTVGKIFVYRSDAWHWYRIEAREVSELF